MKQSVLTVWENDRIAESVYRMVLEGPELEEQKPGQFVNIRLDGQFLRRPISVCESEAGMLTIIYKVIGRGTEALSRRRRRDTLDVLTGLGNGYDLSKAGDRPLLLGGGVGVPPLVMLARKLREQGKDVTAVLGFNTKEEVFGETAFRMMDCTAVVTTVDGSYGVKGFVTDGLTADGRYVPGDGYGSAGRYASGDGYGRTGAERVAPGDGGADHGEADGSYSYFYTCGPEPMLRAVYRKTVTSGQFSFEERMGCGFGACMGCSCRTITGYKRICREGPVLEKEEILWAERI